MNQKLMTNLDQLCVGCLFWNDASTFKELHCVLSINTKTIRYVNLITLLITDYNPDDTLYQVAQDVMIQYI